MTNKYVLDRRPANLDDAPEFLNVTQVASALGCSREQVRQLETSDPSFPRRRPLPFAKLERFSRRELMRWADARSQIEEVGA